MENDILEVNGIISGALIGDAGKQRSTFYFRHSIKQLDFALHKKSLIDEALGSECSVRIKKDGLFPSVNVYVHAHPYVKRLVYELYGDIKSNKGEKKITRCFLDNLTMRGIALWYMDDGSRSVKKRNEKPHSLEITLNTYLTKEENEIIILYFKEKWGILWNLNKSKGKYRLRMGTREGRKFFALIQPFIINSMNYKIKSDLS